MSNLMKIENVPHYAEVEVLGITAGVGGEHINGSRERKTFKGRRILTETVGFDATADDAAMIAKGDGTRVVQTVSKAEKISVKIVLGDGFKSRDLELTNVLFYTDKKDNVGSPIILLHEKEISDANRAVLDKIAEFAPRMVEAHPDSFGDWWLEDSDGKRVFIYFYKDVDAATGKGVPQD